jgi:hypothetical protein
MRCVRLCPNDSPQLNLRLPGWDIVANEHLGHKTSLLIIALLSVPYAIVMFESKSLHQYYSFFNFTLLFWSLPFIAGFILWVINYMFLRPDKKDNIHNFLDVLNVYIPLALAANVGLQLKYIPIFPKININSNLLGTDKIFSFSLLNLSQAILMLSGLVFSYLFMYLRSIRFEEKQQILYYISHHIIMFVYCLSFLYFLI